MLALLVTLLTLWVSSEAAAKQPHIVLILADDLGYNDVSWHNPDIISPHLEKLATEGVLLEHSYVQPLCTPTRSALLTGRYPFHLGRQHSALQPIQPTGLTVNATLLPELLRTAGYRTHMVGKWHLGFCAQEYLPLSRGFESYLGYWEGQEDYFNKSLNLMRRTVYDFFEDDQFVAPEYMGRYSTDVFAERAEGIISSHDPEEPLFLYLPFQSVHTPTEAPKEYKDLYPDIKDDLRRTFSGMVTAMDDAVGRVVDALKAADLYDNSVIVFLSDNGADTGGNPQPNAAGNNLPLRGAKMTIWEGGTRTPAFIHSPLLEKTGYVSQEMIHVTDWLPTLLKIAGADGELVGADAVDGVDQWAMLSTGAPSARDEIVYNIDNYGGTFTAALRVGDLKLVLGDNSQGGDWYPVRGTTAGHDDVQAGQFTLPASWGDQKDLRDLPALLFNVTADPTEHEDLSEKMPEVVKQLQDRVEQLMETLVPADWPQNDLRGLPRNGEHWFTGWCEPQ